MLTQDIFLFQNESGEEIPYIQLRKIQGDFDTKPSLTLLEWETNNAGLKTGGKVIHHYLITGVKATNNDSLNAYILKQVNIKK